MHARVVSVSGEQCFAMELPGDTTIWEVKSIVRALRGTPRRTQTFLVGERLAGAPTRRGPECSLCRGCRRLSMAAVACS